MSAYREFTGKSVEEALKAAREEFGVELNDLDFEILTAGSRGVLGMGAEPARIVAAPRSALGGAAPKREAAASTPLPPAPPREDRGRARIARARIARATIAAPAATIAGTATAAHAATTAAPAATTATPARRRFRLRLPRSSPRWRRTSPASPASRRAAARRAATTAARAATTAAAGARRT